MPAAFKVVDRDGSRWSSITAVVGTAFSSPKSLQEDARITHILKSQVYAIN